MRTQSADRPQPVLSPEERGRIWYESGDATDPPWESLTPAERAAWIAQVGDADVIWVQWQPDVRH